jgi:hypothetical protein
MVIAAAVSEPDPHGEERRAYEIIQRTVPRAARLEP